MVMSWPCGDGMAVMFIFMASEFGIPFVHHRYTALSELSNSMLKRGECDRSVTG